MNYPDEPQPIGRRPPPARAGRAVPTGVSPQVEVCNGVWPRRGLEWLHPWASSPLPMRKVLELTFQLACSMVYGMTYPVNDHGEAPGQRTRG
jgi:hypothetical protein